MMMKFRILLVAAVIIAFYFMFKMIIKGKLQLKYSLLWMMLGLILLILTIFPRLLDYISGFIGVFSPTNALFLFGFAFTLPVIFGLSLSLSKLSTRVKDLAQQLALLNHELNKKDGQRDK